MTVYDCIWLYMTVYDLWLNSQNMSNWAQSVGFFGLNFEHYLFCCRLQCAYRGFPNRGTPNTPTSDRFGIKTKKVWGSPILGILHIRAIAGWWLVVVCVCLLAWLCSSSRDFLLPFSALLSICRSSPCALPGQPSSSTSRSKKECAFERLCMKLDAPKFPHLPTVHHSFPRKIAVFG